MKNSFHYNATEGHTKSDTMHSKKKKNIDFHKFWYHCHFELYVKLKLAGNIPVLDPAVVSNSVNNICMDDALNLFPTLK